MLHYHTIKTMSLSNEELTSPLTRRKRVRRPACFLVTITVLSAFCNGLFLNIRGPCIKDLASRAGITSSHMGWFFIASGAGGVIAAVPAGKLIDYFQNPMTTLCAGLLVRAATCFALPYVSSSTPLLFVGIAQGITLPVVGISLRAAILWTYGGKRSTPYLNLVMAAFGGGSMVAPLLYDWFSVVVTSSAPLDWTFWGLAGFSILLAGASLCVDRTRFQQHSTGQQEEVGRSEEHEEYDRDQDLQDLQDSQEHAPEEPPLRETWMFFMLLLLYMAISVGIEGTLGSWLYTLAGGNKVTGFSTATWVNTALWASFTATRLVLVFVSRTVSETIILQVSHAIMLGGLLGALLTFKLTPGGGLEGVTYPPWSLWLLTVSFGIGIAPSFPNVMGLAGKLYPWKFSGTIQSTFGVAANAGNGVFPGLAGLLTDVRNVGGLAFVYVPFIGVIMMQVLLMLLHCWRPQLASN
jgi:MFS family permease